ncbi:hypothetical protein O0L34_g17532 [Tuta absoluta]|nr:hypothetical protein O0L34_g17532 [Tuta absoluta]
MNPSWEYQFVVVLMVCLMMESFCCCISLEAGTKVISVVSTVTSLVIVMVYGCPVLMMQLPRVKLVFYSAMSLVAGLQCLCGFLLWWGAFKRHPKLMWPWLVVVWVTGFSLLGVSVVGYALLIIERSLTADANMVMSTYVIYSFYLLYCAFVVNNRRLELMKEEEEKPRQLLMFLPPPYKDV